MNSRGSLKRGVGAFKEFGYFSRGSLKRGVAAFQVFGYSLKGLLKERAGCV